MKNTLNKNRAIICVVIFIGLMIIVTMIIAGVQLSKPYRYSAKLVAAINEGNYKKAKAIIEKHNFDLNTPTSKPNKFWNALTESTPATPLSAACYMGNYEMVKFLIENGATGKHVEGTTWPAIIQAVRKYDPDDYKIIELLLDNGADPNLIYTNMTAIEHAAKMSPICKNEHGDYYYNEEVACEIVKIVKLFVEKGGSVDGSDIGENYTLAFGAVEASNIALLEYVLDDLKTDVNKKDSYEKTAAFALYYKTLARYPGCYKKMTEILTAHGADLLIKDLYGKTVYDYAVETGNTELTELLMP